MHSCGYRLSALFTFGVTILGLICGLASFFDKFNSPTPTSQVQVLDVNWFKRHPNGNDHVSLKKNILADLQSLFTLNTKQVSLWDDIIPSKENAKFQIHTTNKYGFTDQVSNLWGIAFSRTLHWHVMPKIGKMFADKIVMSGFRMPNDTDSTSS